jgi:hypothetical protein
MRDRSCGKQDVGGVLNVVSGVSGFEFVRMMMMLVIVMMQHDEVTLGEGDGSKVGPCTRRWRR